MEISRDLEVWKMTEMPNPLRSHGIQFNVLLLAVQDSSLRGASDFVFFNFFDQPGGGAFAVPTFDQNLPKKFAFELSINEINQAIRYINSISPWVRGGGADLPPSSLIKEKTSNSYISRNK